MTLRAGLLAGAVLLAACGSAGSPRPVAGDPPEVTTIEAPVVREIVRDEPTAPDDGNGNGGARPEPPVPDGPPASWRPSRMAPTVDRQIRSLLQKAHPAPLRIVRWLLFDHEDGRGTGYAMFEQSRHDACQALARASRTTEGRTEARARFENECAAQSSVPMQRCKYVGLARFSIVGMPPPDVENATARVELTADEVLDPELCTYGISAFFLRDVDGEPDPEVTVEFEWQDLVSSASGQPEPTKKAHSLLVFRSDLSVQEARILGTEYFAEGEPIPDAPTRGSYQLEDVNRDSHADLVIRKETVEHCRGCRSRTEREVYRYDPRTDAWR